MKFFNRVINLLLLAILLPAAISFAGDATSFDPTKVTIKATSAGGVPVGTIVAWPVATNPADMNKWLECNGQSVSSSVYPELFALVGGNVPDYRGLFLRGHGSQAHAQNNGSTVGVTSTTHSSGALGTVQGDATRNITGHINYEGTADGGFVNDGYIIPGVISSTEPNGRDWNLTFDASRVVPVANENRPVNTAIRYLIRALP
jgi:hypothetical protein